MRERLKLSLPVRVNCRESQELEWTEVTRLLDVTPFGARFSLSRPIVPGRLLRLMLPMPRRLRCFDHIEDQYRIWALVRNVKVVMTAGSAPRFEVGVAFIGKRPPASYETEPSTLYDAAPVTDKDSFCTVQEQPKGPGNGSRSSETRLNMPIEVVVEAFDESGQMTAQRETTVTENISRRGAAVFATTPIERGRYVLLTCSMYQLSVLAIIRACRTGADGITRLHLEFMDRQLPLDGID